MYIIHVHINTHTHLVYVPGTTLHTYMTWHTYIQYILHIFYMKKSDWTLDSLFGPHCGHRLVLTFTCQTLVHRLVLEGTLHETTIPARFTCIFSFCVGRPWTFHAIKCTSAWIMTFFTRQWVGSGPRTKMCSWTKTTAFFSWQSLYVTIIPRWTP